MLLCIFLGNPGKKYENTRHNAGWLFAEYLRKKWDLPEWKEESKFFGEILKIPPAPPLSRGESPLFKGDLGDLKKIVFLKPNTFMNLSGKSALAVSQFYKIPTENILIIYDDKDQELGNIRYREKGSSGGHNGVKDMIRVFGTEEINRLKIGVDSQKRTEFKIPTADFVLSNFSEEEMERLEGEIFLELEGKLIEWLEKEARR